MSGETFASRLNSPPASRQSWPCLSWVLPEGTVDATIRQYNTQPPFHISRFGECFPRGREQESGKTPILSDSWNTDSTPRHHLRSRSSSKMKYAGFSVIPGKRDRALFQLAYHHGLCASEVSLL